LQLQRQLPTWADATSGASVCFKTCIKTVAVPQA
jgi:hypothetical protein